MRLIDAYTLVKYFIKKCGAIPFVESKDGNPIYVDHMINEQSTVCINASCDWRKDNWIPVEERLPECDCIVYEANSGKVMFSYHEELDAADWNVIAWQPLPKPYKPKEGNEQNVRV